MIWDTSFHLFMAYRWIPSTPRERYLSICLIVYSIPAFLKSAFFCSSESSKGALSKGLGKIQYILGQRGIKILDSIYTDKVEIAALVPLDVLEAVKAEIREGTNGQAGMEEGEQCYFAEVQGEIVILDQV